MTVKEYTTYQQLEIPYYDIPGWHQYIDRNFHALDGAMYILTGATNLRGVWRNSTVYSVGHQVVDHLTNTIHKCLIQHTSPATGTFLADRTANPTRWSAALTLFQGTSTPDRFEFLNTDDAVSTTDASVEFRGGVGIAKRLYVGSYVSIASTDQYGLAVGRQGRTDPAFSVYTATANTVTGVRIIPQVGGQGAYIDVTSPGGNEHLYINAKGTGQIRLGTVSTGPIVITKQTVINSPLNIEWDAGAALTVGVAPDYALRVNSTPDGGGIMISPAAAGAGVTIMAISSVANEPLYIDAKGTGHIVLNASATGVITTPRRITVTDTTVSTSWGTGAITVIGGLGVGGDIFAGASITSGGGTTHNVAAGGSFVGMNAISAVVLDGKPVLRKQTPGWGTPTTTTNRATFDNAATLATVAQVLGTLILDLRAHGMIGN